MNATYAFVLINDHDWKTSIPDDWEWNIVELEGSEKTIGHHKIDGMTYKVLQSNDKIIAICK